MVTLNLLCTVPITLTPVDGGTPTTFLLEQFSSTALTGKSRSSYKHGIDAWLTNDAKWAAKGVIPDHNSPITKSKGSVRLQPTAFYHYALSVGCKTWHSFGLTLGP